MLTIPSFVLVGCGAPLQPPTPQILQGATTGPEVFEMCPGAIHNHHWQVAASPEFEAELKRQIPEGQSEQGLLDLLTAQGFQQDEAPCKNDPAVRSATFMQRGGGSLNYPVLATAYWRVDVNNKIEWIRGNISYTGP